MFKAVVCVLTEFQVSVEGIGKGGPALGDGLREFGSRVDGEVQVVGRGEGSNLGLDTHRFSGDH